ncbi:hypothetical protein M0C34_08785 [Agarivorans sp. TSD2052]|uniref:phospholipase C n=1 Tax=Agarivorans sp. TSD2052 TaxID=2937286 RepID=UPI002010B24C|nr:alkaline phosphatase family protein [Agarivorans sp. TSD2052]UPW20340.1 hypothetical protein M0C34_08785 [Agarivorans sp. TSD2052]
MNDIITAINVDGTMQIQPAFGTNSGFEYKFKTNFRNSHTVLSGNKLISISVKQINPGFQVPIEVMLVKPGSNNEFAMVQPDIDNVPGVLAAINDGIGPLPEFGEDAGVFIDDNRPGGASPPVVDERYKYLIKDADLDGTWTLRIRNKSTVTESFNIHLIHPDLQLTLSETAVPLSLLNRLLLKVHKLVGMRVRLDNTASVKFNPEFSKMLGVDNITKPLDLPLGARLRDLNLIVPCPQIGRRGNDTLSLPIPLEFETTGPAEIDIAGPNINITQFSFNIELLFKGAFPYRETRNLAAEKIDARNANGHLTLKHDSQISISTLGIIESSIRDAINSEINGLLDGADMNKTLADIAPHVTEGIMFLAKGNDDRQFYDLRMTDAQMIVRHYATPSHKLRLQEAFQPDHEFEPLLVAQAFTPVTPTVPTTVPFQFLTQGFTPTFVGTTGTMAPETPTNGGAAKKIEHIVVLMLENRSFDHMLGYLTSKKGRNDIDGLGNIASYSNPIPGGNQTQSILRLQDGKAVQVDPGHSVTANQEQIAGGEMSGFLSNYLRKSAFSNDPEGANVVMGFYDDEHLEVFDQLADEYMVCDRWFCSHPGPTYPNRFISLMGSTPDVNNLELESRLAGAVKGTTIFDLLSEGNVSWNYVESNISFLRMFEKYRIDETNIVQRNNWLTKARNGNLPAVSWIDPHIGNLEIDDDADDDHPPSNVVRGQEGVFEIYAALTANKQQWDKTLFVITYDEHGGFYDHVPPHGINSNTAPEVHKIHPDGATHYGPRVPALLVSPWIKKRSVSSTVFDHTSLLKTILVNFLGEEAGNQNLLGPRVDAANSLLDQLENTKRANTVILQAPAPAANFAPGDVNIPIEKSSFHLGMRLFPFGLQFRTQVASKVDD